MNPLTLNSDFPLLGLAIGDPAGIGPELAIKILADDEIRRSVHFVVIGDRRVFELGMEQARIPLEIPVITSPEEIDRKQTVFLDLGHLDPATIPLGVASKAGGTFCLENFRTALKLAERGILQGVCFTPFNKSAMRMADPSYDDEIGFIGAVLNMSTKSGEFNILEGLWNARVTSHMPISAVAGHIRREDVLNSIRFTWENLRTAGFEKPRIAVAGLNPHAGDGGNFGHEDQAEIRPAVEAAQALGIHAEGPFPPDTVFVQATKGLFDAVVTMYHDQGQIAMKLIGFDRGVTLLGGYPFPVCTPAHGSAYDIAGKGVANPRASCAAALLARNMVIRSRLPAQFVASP